MKRTFILKDKRSFKHKNLTNWYKNTDLWLQGKMRHLKDIYDFTGEKIEEIIRSKQSINGIRLLDLGCGEGWILRLIMERSIDVDYTGIDFNIQFINALQEKYQNTKGIRFECLDIEESVPNRLVGFADIAVNFFNFFEIPNIHAAFANAARMLKRNGILLVVSIDPVMQILAVSKDYKTFIGNLKKYETYQTELAYDKELDVEGGACRQFYRGILYSTATYVEIGKKNNLAIRDYKEVVKTGNSVPQIYQFIYFEKNG